MSHIDPSLPDTTTNEIKVDRGNAFMLYATFCGDCVRTGAALGISAIAVLKMADEESWAEQLKPILELKKSSRPGDIERAINRALNFVQVRKMTMFLERVIRKLTDMSPEELEEYLLYDRPSKDGTQVKRLTTRALADLASAIEKCHSLSYAALNDSAQERVRRKESDSGGSASDLHLAIAEAMGKVKSSNSPRALLFDAQLSTAQEIVATSIVPRNPNDDDDH